MNPFVGPESAPDGAARCLLLSGFEWIVILVIALLILGPGKLPDVASAVGKSIREFRKASSDVQDAVKLDTSPLPAGPAQPRPRPRRQTQPTVQSRTSPPSRSPVAPIAPTVAGLAGGHHDRGARAGRRRQPDRRRAQGQRLGVAPKLMTDADALREGAVQDGVPPQPAPPPCRPRPQPRTASCVVRRPPDRAANRLFKVLLLTSPSSASSAVSGLKRSSRWRPARRELLNPPGDAFAITLRCRSSPGSSCRCLILYQLWAFVAPGLTARKSGRRSGRGSRLHSFFVFGVALRHFVLPYAMNSPLGFATGTF